MFTKVLLLYYDCILLRRRSAGPRDLATERRDRRVVGANIIDAYRAIEIVLFYNRFLVYTRETETDNRKAFISLRTM